ncbi:nucleotidyltransferase [Cupriavidus oxalaticus]|uniref:nucleotidyltransferase n=1 Tax=Cupriavidus oxalaticus TaxID=96344 RepID=UPI004034A99B
MPRNIEQGFSDFLAKLRATRAETAATASHRASIEACLRANFGLNRLTRIGSFGNGTNVSGYSDVDYLACIPTQHLTQSSTYTLTKVKDALATRFPNTGICVRCPTVYCPFGTYRSEDTEIVVADYIKEQGGYKVYEIADGSGGWTRISPDAHNSYVKSVDDKLNGRVKPLIRFLKAWKFYQNVPISSFYLEMRVAKYASAETIILNDIDIKIFLSRLLDGGLADLQDPMGFSGYVKPCKSAAAHEEALSKLKTAARRAEKAWVAARDGDIKDAFDWWQLFYDNKFPSYYL